MLQAILNNIERNAAMKIDVGIVGSGFAGLSAAIGAANSGAQKVAIFEKMNQPGGNSVVSRFNASSSLANWRHAKSNTCHLYQFDRHLSRRMQVRLRL